MLSLTITILKAWQRKQAVLKAASSTFDTSPRCDQGGPDGGGELDVVEVIERDRAKDEQQKRRLPSWSRYWGLRWVTSGTWR